MFLSLAASFFRCCRFFFGAGLSGRRRPTCIDHGLPALGGVLDGRSDPEGIRKDVDWTGVSRRRAFRSGARGRPRPRDREGPTSVAQWAGCSAERGRQPERNARLLEGSRAGKGTFKNNRDQKETFRILKKRKSCRYFLYYPLSRPFEGLP